MHKKKPDRTLESFWFFPYVAWAITILFALFVYQIALDLQEVSSRLENQTSLKNNVVSTPVNEVPVSQ